MSHHALIFLCFVCYFSSYKGTGVSGLETTLVTSAISAVTFFQDNSQLQVFYVIQRIIYYSHVFGLDAFVCQRASKIKINSEWRARSSRQKSTSNWVLAKSSGHNWTSPIKNPNNGLSNPEFTNVQLH